MHCHTPIHTHPNVQRQLDNHTHSQSFPLFNVHTLSHTHTHAQADALTRVAPKKIFLLFPASFSFSSVSFVTEIQTLSFLPSSFSCLQLRRRRRRRRNASQRVLHLSFKSLLQFFPFFWQLEERKEKKNLFCSFPSFVCLIADNLFPAFCWI